MFNNIKELITNQLQKKSFKLRIKPINARVQIIQIQVYNITYFKIHFINSFNVIFSPKTNQQLSQRLFDQYQEYIQSQDRYIQTQISQTEVPYFIEDLVVKYLELEAQKMYFTTKYGKDILRAFKNISDQGHGYDILSKRNGFTFTHENFNYLMNKIDRDGNGIISKDEFLDENFILPSYRFASYSTMMTSQKFNNGNQSTGFERTGSPGSYKNFDQSDQKVQFSFFQKQKPGEYSQRNSAPQYDQNGQYQGLQYGQSQPLQNGLFNNNNQEQEYIQQRIQMLKQQQQQQNQQNYQNPENISNSNKQPQRNPYESYRQPSLTHQMDSSNSPHNDIMNDSQDHVNQVYASKQSQSNLGVLSSKKINY